VLLTAALLPLFVSLGLWQWNRGQLRQQDWQQFTRSDLPAQDVPASRLAEMPRYARVRVRGQLDGERQFLLDNMSHHGAPGYHVLTVLQLEEGSHLLVNRGWVPFSGFREQLPDVALPRQAEGVRVELTGRLAGLPSVGLASGRMPPTDGPWPRVTSFPTMEQLAAAYGGRLLPVVLLLDADSGPGFVREWHAPGLPPERHVGYAVQWWAFALLLVGLFVGLNLKKRDD
jgi:surfeit locus 1 family protein